MECASGYGSDCCVKAMGKQEATEPGKEIARRGGCPERKERGVDGVEVRDFIEPRIAPISTNRGLDLPTRTRRLVQDDRNVGGQFLGNRYSRPPCRGRLGMIGSDSGGTTGSAPQPPAAGSKRGRLGFLGGRTRFD